MRAPHPLLLPQANVDLSQVNKLGRFVDSKPLPSMLSQLAVTSWGNAVLPSRTYPNSPSPPPAAPLLQRPHHTRDLSGRPNH